MAPASGVGSSKDKAVEEVGVEARDGGGRVVQAGGGHERFPHPGPGLLGGRGRGQSGYHRGDGHARAAASAARTPDRPRIGPSLATGLLGARITRSASVIAGSTAGAGRASAKPSCLTARTFGCARRATRYS